VGAAAAPAAGVRACALEVLDGGPAERRGFIGSTQEVVKYWPTSEAADWDAAHGTFGGGTTRPDTRLDAGVGT
jgi:hypothetical protein